MAVMPLRPGTKIPALPDWERAASRDPRVVAERWSARTTGYGIACGPSGLYVVDCDIPKPGTPPPPPELGDAATGIEALMILAAQAGEPMPTGTFTVRTGSGGYQLYFRAPHGVDLHNSAYRPDHEWSIGWCIDSRGVGGQVVGPGSAVAGRSYEIVDHAPPAQLPAWLLARVLERQKAASQAGESRPAPSTVRLSGTAVGPEWATAALDRELARIAAHPGSQGGRNHLLNSVAYTLGRLVGGQILERGRVVDALLAATRPWWGVGDPPFSAREAASTIRSGIDAGERNPRTPEPREPRRRVA